MRKKILPVLALCTMISSPASAMKFCPYTATLAIIGMLEVARQNVPEYARPLRLAQGAAGAVFVAFMGNFLWKALSPTLPPEKEKAKIDETQSHS